MEVLLFGHKKCNPCQNLKKELTKKGVNYTDIDVEKEPEKAIEYMIHSVPTLIIKDKNKIKEMYVGNRKEVWRLLKKYKILKGDE